MQDLEIMQENPPHNKNCGSRNGFEDSLPSHLTTGFTFEPNDASSRQVQSTYRDVGERKEMMAENG